MHRQAGASVHLCDRQGTSPLLVAAKFGQAAAVEALIAAGADYERTSDSGLSPIDAALENGHAAVVRVLFAAARAKREWALAEMRQRECDVDALNQQITQRENTESSRAHSTRRELISSCTCTACVCCRMAQAELVCSLRLVSVLQAQRICCRCDTSCKRDPRR